MWPFVGFSKPSSSLTVVDLPEPFGAEQAEDLAAPDCQNPHCPPRAPWGPVPEILEHFRQTAHGNDHFVRLVDCGLRIADLIRRLAWLISIWLFDQQAQGGSETGFVQSFFCNFDHSFVNRTVVFRNRTPFNLKNEMRLLRPVRLLPSTKACDSAM